MELFSELYSAYYNAVEHVLRAAQGKDIRAEALQELLSAHTFSESAFHMLPKLQGGQWPLLRAENGGYTARYALPEALPLTALQKAWLKALLRDPRMRLFMDDEAFAQMEAALADVEPLFRQEDLHVFDNAGDGDDYGSEAYREVFRVFLAAVRSGSAVYVRYDNGSQRMADAYWPVRLEYSPKDDKFRAYCHSRGNRRRKTYVLNLQRVTAAEAVPDEIRRPAAPDGVNGMFHEVVMEIGRERNALERCMLQFAHFEKRTEYDEHTDKYTCTLRYNAMDETEVVIRVLSFGPTLRVLGPERFLAELRGRVRAQARLLARTEAE